MCFRPQIPVGFYDVAHLNRLCLQMTCFGVSLRASECWLEIDLLLFELKFEICGGSGRLSACFGLASGFVVSLGLNSGLGFLDGLGRNGLPESLLG